MHSRQQLLDLCDCENCPIGRAGRRNPVLGSGPDSAKVVLVGEAPGKNEHIQGVPFVGQSGKLLDMTLDRVGLRREDVYVTNSVLCRPDEFNATPHPEAVRACNARLQAEVRDRAPEMIIPVGASGAQALLNSKSKISELQGVLQHSSELNAWILPTYHPAYCLRSPAYYEDFLGDFDRAAELVLGEVKYPPKHLQWEYEHFTTNDIADAQHALAALATGNFGYELSFDVETDNVNTSSRLLTIQFGTTEKAWVFDSDIFTEDNDTRELVEDLLMSPLHTFIIHNMSFDLQVVYDFFGIHHSEMGELVDTICLALGTTERSQATGLKYLARKWFNAPYYEAELQQYLPTSKTPYSAIPRPVLAKYAAADTIYTARLRPVLDDLVEKYGTKSLVYDLLMPAQKAFADMQYHGTAVDLRKVKELRKTWIPEIRRQAKEIEDYAKANGWPHPYFNPGSTQQLSEFLFDILKLAPPRPTNKEIQEARAKGKKPTRHTGKEFRSEYPNHPITPLLERYATTRKMFSTYVEGIADDVRGDRRIHPNFLLWGTVTGRLAIQDPPLQTIPRRDTAGTVFDDLRTLFIARALPDDPEPNLEFFGADYKQLELRIAWLLSGDPNMGEAILSGDFHRVTAANIWGMPQAQVTSVQRHNTKYVTFGIMYGREAFSLWKGQLGESGMTLRQCEEFVEAWFARFPVFAEWYRNNRANALRTGRLRTPFGRVRRWPLITEEHKKHILNEAANFPPQSVASDTTLHAMIRLNDRFRRENLGRILFAVHDSIEGEYFMSRKEEAIRAVYEEMTMLPPQLANIAPPNFELAIDLEVGPSWGESHEPEEFKKLIASASAKRS